MVRVILRAVNTNTKCTYLIIQIPWQLANCSLLIFYLRIISRIPGNFSSFLFVNTYFQFYLYINCSMVRITLTLLIHAFTNDVFSVLLYIIVEKGICRFHKRRKTDVSNHKAATIRERIHHLFASECTDTCRVSKLAVEWKVGLPKKQQRKKRSVTISRELRSNFILRALDAVGRQFLRLPLSTRTISGKHVG